MLVLLSDDTSLFSVTVYPEEDYGRGSGWYMHSTLDPDKHFTPAEIREQVGEAIMNRLREQANEAAGYTVF